MKRIILPFLFAGVLFASCNKETIHVPGGKPKDVVVNFTAKSMSDVAARSSASVGENAITKVAVFGLDADGNLEQSFPIIENPQITGSVLSVLNTVKTLKFIANPTSDLKLDYQTLSQMQSATANFASAPVSPFLMSGEANVQSSSINVELVRSVAKIEVKGSPEFEVTSVTVVKTPTMGYVFALAQIPTFSTSEYVSYPQTEGGVVYVAENSKQTPTQLLVKGNYKGNPTAYTVILKKNSENLDIVRNTCYVVSVTPISDVDCSVDVIIPEWNDMVADENFIPNFGTYYSSDFHQHTAFSDGNNPITFVLNQGLKFNLDITVNSEHGGAFNRNASQGDQETTSTPLPTWVESGLSVGDFLGDANGSGNTQNMWRWQSIKDYSYPKVKAFNERGTSTIAIQGLEWNPPGHEHCSSGIISGQFDKSNPNATAMAQFEYMFDNNDSDKTGGAAYGWVKSTKSGHEKSMEAAAWLQANYRYSSWLVPAHPERQNKWQIQDYRDLNDIAPDVFVAFESIPGHQASSQRGGIGNSSSYKKSYTYGGVGVQSAKIGDLWDAMLSEGRRFWLVANSDFHAHVTRGDGDFYPGEYQKTYISMKDKSAQSFVDGLRSGNLYAVHGDVIDRLEFSVGNATMGQTFKTDKSSVKVRILVRDPETANNNQFSSLTNPKLDHIDLIAGEMRPKAVKGSPEYNVNTYDKVKVVARFDANGGVVDGNGIMSTKWTDLGDGLKLVEYNVNITGDTYFRLRGTNHGLNVSGETDEFGNPLQDVPTTSVIEGAKSAYADLWFYSSPVFVRAK